MANMDTPPLGKNPKVTQMTEVQNEAAQIEEEASADSGINERRKIEIPEDMDAKTVEEKYKVSRSTAWRAKQRGWIFINYHQRVIDQDIEWANEHSSEIKKSAEIGADLALRMLGMKRSELFPFGIEDLISAGYIRLLEICGHPNRDIALWRNAVARNAASLFIRTEILPARKMLGNDNEEKREDLENLSSE